MTSNSTQLKPELTRLFRASSGQILAALTAYCGDLDAAEDALQDAWLKASQAWRHHELPSNPAGWIFTVAKRRLIDITRAHTRHTATQRSQALESQLLHSQRADEASQTIPDERLKLIFICCHPAINQPAQIALTLKTLCGLSAREIARAYLVSETTMQQRLVRAKNKIKSAGIAYVVPRESELTERLESVLAVIYLIYNESYTAFEGQTLGREDLANEAIRLAKVLFELLPKPAVAGLLALMLFHQARSPARQSLLQGYIPLENQDRTLWKQAQISQARSVLLGALAQASPDKYQLQAAISALHCEAPSWAETDWEQILGLYVTLYKLEPTPVVKLNGLAALSHSGRALEALEKLQDLAHPLQNYQPFHAAKADILIRLERKDEAIESLENAVMLSNNAAEKDFLRNRINSLG